MTQVGAQVAHAGPFSSKMKFTPRNRAHWRNWLENNHARANEVWLVFVKQHTGRANVSYNDAVEEALCFGWIDSVKRSIDDDHYMHRFTPRKSNSRWSKSNKVRAERMLEAGRMAPAGKRSVEQAKSSGQWTEVTDARASFSMPPELSRRLQQNPKASEYFEALAPSYQRQYIAWIATAKRPDTRKRRLDETMELLERGEKLGMR